MSSSRKVRPVLFAFIGAGLLSAFLAGTFAWRHFTALPRHQGETSGYWVDQMRRHKFKGAREALERIGSDADMIALLSDGDWQVREAAAIVLRGRETREVLEALGAAMRSDPADSVRNAAAAGIVHNGHVDDRTFPLYLDVIRNRTLLEHLRVQAIRALRPPSCSDSDVAETLLSVLPERAASLPNHPVAEANAAADRNEVSKAASETLRLFGPAVLDNLRSALRRPDVRRFVVPILADQGEKARPAIPDLEALAVEAKALESVEGPERGLHASTLRALSRIDPEGHLVPGK